jgi:uncharacterized repeat protein (TIGR01451 family)
LEVKLSWKNVFGTVPNRISLAAFTFRSGDVSVYDWCPNAVRNPTNWVTIDPDNNGDNVPDGAAPAVRVPGLSVGKAVTNVSIGGKLLGVTNSLIPGSTIHYQIVWQNNGEVSLTNVILFDVMPGGTVYVSNSLRMTNDFGTSKWTNQYSMSAFPDQNFISGDYSSVQGSPVSGTKWVRSKTVSLPVGESGFMRFKVVAGNIAGGALFANTVQSTCRQFSVLGTNMKTIMAATQYGGRFSAAKMETCYSPSGGYTNFLIYFTNKGNSVATWTFNFKSVVSNGPGNGWDFGIGTRYNGRNKTFTTNIGILSRIGLVIFMTDSGAPAGAASLALRLHATNTRYPAYTKSIWTNYRGDNGAYYGGSMGESWSGIGQAIYPGEVFIQGLGDSQSGNVILKITSTPVPVLGITKRCDDVRLGGSVSGAIPGASITYALACTNSGTGTAYSNMIYDRIPIGTRYVTNSAKVTNGWTPYWSTNAAPSFAYNGAGWTATQPAVSKIRWVKWQRGIMNPGDKFAVRFKVAIF